MGGRKKQGKRKKEGDDAIDINQWMVGSGAKKNKKGDRVDVLVDRVIG